MLRLLQILLLLALVVVVWRLVRKALSSPPPPARGDGPPAFEATARCGRCGTHVPREQLDPAGLCPRCR